MQAAPLLQISNLSKRYGRRIVLDDITFSAPSGTIVALLGPNGAGKTTLFKCLLGVTPFSGSVVVGGLSVAEHGKQVRARVGYLPQSPAFNERDTCLRALIFLADLRSVPASQATALLERVGLADNAGDRVGEISGGMRQRLALAAALLSDPGLLLLDEPTANLDWESREKLETLMQELKAQGKTIIVSTHFVEGIDRLADQVLVLSAGRTVLRGATNDLLQPSGRQFSVYLNGTDPAVLTEALSAAGIDSGRVTPVESRLTDVVARALAESNKTAGEPS